VAIVERKWGDTIMPLIAAPMFLVTGPELVIEACKAGIGAAIPSSTARSAEQYNEWMCEIEEALAAFARDTGKTPGPWAANFSAGSKRLGSEERATRDLESCRQHKVSVIVTTGGVPADIVRAAHSWGGRVFHDAVTVRHAEKAAESGVDGINLIAGGGGGHAGFVSAFALVPVVRRFFEGTIVLGGAVGTGSGILAAQALGADYCYMGTRFIATRESRAPQAYKEMLVESTTKEIIYTPVFTHGVNCNFMRRSILANGFDPDALHSAAQNPLIETRKPWRDIWAAGHSVGVIDEIMSVAELVAKLHAEYVAARDSLGARLDFKS